MTTKPSTAAVAKGADAIALLIADRKAVKALFKDFEKVAKEEDTDEQKADLVLQICNELTVHSQVEEEIFYPAVRQAIEDNDLLDEAAVEHATAKDLIAQLREMGPDDDLYDAKVTVLSAYIDHHVNEEEGDMFPKARNADLDTRRLGKQMASRKEELKAELGMLDDDSHVPPRVKLASGSKRASKAVR
jgi:hemerythrin superfamily protein